MSLSSSVTRAALLLAIALAGCSTPAEVSCLPGESPCHGACIPSATACPGAATDMAQPGCSLPSDCPAPATACKVNHCTAGACGTTNAAAGTPCNDSGGTICDGNGACVAGCSLPTDCPATTTTACIANLCDPMLHVCRLVDAPAGVPCNDHGGTVCDGNGTCVPGGAPGAACTSNMQCAAGTCGPGGSGTHCCAQSCATGPCGAVDCDATGACVLAPMGMPCGAGLCNGAGTCVLPCGQSAYKCVFVTSQSHDGNLGGTAGADATCASAASTAGVVGTFVAWLSVSSTNANTRIGAGTMPYQLLDGTPIAADAAALSGGSLLGPIDRDETGRLVAPGDVWTNTSPDGTANAGGACGDFTSNSNASTPAVTGSSGAADATWTDAHAISCDGAARLYCFEQ